MMGQLPWSARADGTAPDADPPADVDLTGSAALAGFLGRRFAPSTVGVHATGGEPSAIVAMADLRSLRVAMLRVDRPVSLEITAVVGPVLVVPAGYGLAPEAITRPASDGARRGAMVVADGATATRTCGATELVVLLDMPQAALQVEAATILGRPLDRELSLAPRIDLTTPTGRRLEAALELLWAQVRQRSPLLASDLAERRLEQVVLDMFLLAADHIEEELVGEDGATIATPWVQRAVDLLTDDPGAHWSVEEVSRQVAVSPRALHHGFRRDLGTTPMAYLQEVRLTRAHDELARRPVRTTVADVAHRVGLSHPGRFASAYRLRFGEAPSETLRR